MGAVIGDLLPLAVGVAVSPIPIIAVILMLLAPRAGGTGAGFLAGWVAGIAVATAVFVLLAGTFDLGTGDQPSESSSWVKLALGVLLLLLGVRQWRSRPRDESEASMPKWMSAIDSFNPVKAAGLGFLLSAVNPKNLIMCAAAGTTTAQGDLSGGEVAGAVGLFTVVAASTVAVPVVAYAVARQRMATPLTDLKAWLTLHNAAVMSVLLVVIGVVLVGKGLGGLA
jgi:threonine/homoserine/homoserine lactone efflux protein